ncbi:Alpha/beta hydrolase-3 [Corchorus capsularis]|uniref:Alpha/beta hydrolase-3 n=1 Tax=Corchorus capsularis TaxID=210143 RepID=A0A1R3J6B6_COCAP|nr:Alpha/beta hydrolase-3 [Corchorus capsularis]
MAQAQQRTKPSLPWKTRMFVSVISTVTDAANRPNGTVNRRLLRFLDFKTSANPKPVNSVSSSDTTVDAPRNLWFRLFAPSIPSNILLPVVIFFHGGGFTYLSPASQAYDAVCRRFARKLPAFVISVNYRLAPEHIYPSQYDDGFDVLKFLDDNYETFLPESADLTRCFLAGDSAAILRRRGENGGGGAASGIVSGFYGKNGFLLESVLAGRFGPRPSGGKRERTERRGYIGAEFPGNNGGGGWI